ncbi:MAG: asparagine synthase-related protein [Gemmatimonadales bacterium]
MGSVLALLARQGTPDVATVERMARAAPHRGDRSQFHDIGGATVAVTWRSDRSDASIHKDPDLVVAFSGILDNAKELCEAWTERNTEPIPSTPAAIVAAGIRKHGAREAARRLRGVFAVVSTDGRAMCAFRDHIGFHPVVYREDARGLFVATEVKQVVAGSGIRREPDLDVLEKILYRELDDDARCAIAGVLHLAPARLLRYEEGRTKILRYWEPETLLETSRLKPPEIHERFHGLMEQAVGRCLTGRDLVSLSGGVDSPAVAAFAAPLHLARTGEPIAALSAFFPDHPSVDETRYIEAAALELGLPIHSFQFSTRPTDDLEKWVQLFDGPVPTIAFSHVFEFLEAAGVLGFHNILSGEQEEFLFEMRRGLLPYLVARRRLAPARLVLRARRARGDSVGLLVKVLSLALAPGWIRSALHPNGRTSLPTWLDGDGRKTYPAKSASQSWRDAQLTAFQGTGLHLPADNAIQAVVGVTERRPFADIDLVEYALSLPAEIKHGDLRHKGFLRGLLRGKVPDLILDRWDKTVFNAFIEANIDYAALRRWLLDPPGSPIPGVRYELLAERLERETLTLPEYMKAKDLACIHAFLSQWAR